MAVTPYSETQSSVYLQGVGQTLILYGTPDQIMAELELPPFMMLGDTGTLDDTGTVEELRHLFRRWKPSDTKQSFRNLVDQAMVLEFA